jgi:hypothetical protein
MADIGVAAVGTFSAVGGVLCGTAVQEVVSWPPFSTSSPYSVRTLSESLPPINVIDPAAVKPKRLKLAPAREDVLVNDPLLTAIVEFRCRHGKGAVAPPF